jgi:transcriptional regulator with XRE-family HTH domain
MPYVKRQPVPLSESQPVTLHGLALGRELRKVIMAAGFNQQTVASKLGMSESRFSRMMTGRYPVTTEDTAGILAVCGVNDERREFLLRLTRTGSIDVLDARQQRSLMRGLQNGAGSLVDCCSMLLPHMVQTRAYAEEVLIRSVGVNDDQIEDQIAGLVDSVGGTTIDLGRTLTAERYELLVSEVALRLPIGSREMMLEQLHEVLKWSTRPRVQLRVVPVETGAHAGMRGSFSIVQHRELTVVTAEDPVHVRFYDDPDDVALYTRVLEAVRAVALTPKASRELISGIASRLLFPEEDQDEPDDVSAEMDEAEDEAEDEPDDAGVGGEADDS